jgi:broad specificity phosphatase PhoE
MYAIQGPYWYRFPQGESIPDLRERLRSIVRTVVRDFSGANVLAVTHHLPVLALRANLEHLDAGQFIELDETQKPINCGVTTYEHQYTAEDVERLKLGAYNEKLY